MKYKVSELDGYLLDAAVSRAVFGYSRSRMVDGKCVGVFNSSSDTIYNPSSNWEIGGPIIESEKICTVFRRRGKWEAMIISDSVFIGSSIFDGDTLLIAAMRIYVFSKLGGEIEIT